MRNFFFKLCDLFLQHLQKVQFFHIFFSSFFDSIGILPWTLFLFSLRSIILGSFWKNNLWLIFILDPLRTERVLRFNKKAPVFFGCKIAELSLICLTGIRKNSWFSANFQHMIWFKAVHLIHKIYHFALHFWPSFFIDDSSDQNLFNIINETTFDINFISDDVVKSKSMKKYLDFH